jgi:hypothetical protein
MVTAATLRAYRRFGGDEDDMARGGSPVPDAEWRALDELLFLCANLKAGTLSPDFAARVRARLAAETDSPETAAAVMEMA